jgi:hypothetical protein
MSDAFPSRSCADAILFHGEVVEAAGRCLVFLLVSCRGHTMCEFLTQCARGSRALWAEMKAGQSIVVPGPDGERSG